MACPLCSQRKARRVCPALGQSICSVCCGTKRLVEIDCPDTCPHLAASRVNPAAAVKRQQEEDLGRLLPTLQTLTERQHQLFFLFQSVIARHRPDGFARLADSDVADAAASLAATLETAAKGLIYQHETQSAVARKLAAELSGLLQQVRGEGATVYDGEAAIALRAIAHGARTLSTPGAVDGYLSLMGRLLQVRRSSAGPASPPISIILP